MPICSPRLEDAGLKDCALPPESIAEAFSSLLRPSPPASYTSPSPTGGGGGGGGGRGGGPCPAAARRPAWEQRRLVAALRHGGDEGV
ncbi:unnamed protein product [Urochloa humidicola]